MRKMVGGWWEVEDYAWETEEETREEGKELLFS
jgi:hypothetical protein